MWFAQDQHHVGFIFDIFDTIMLAKVGLYTILKKRK